jgi:predicted RNA polymerase sigma factor
VAPGRYQILAAINAVHSSARDVRDTDWSQVVALYDQLVRIDPSPIIALNRAIAVAEIDGPEVALAAVDRLEDKLAGYHAYHATRADLLRPCLGSVDTPCRRAASATVNSHDITDSTTWMRVSIGTRSFDRLKIITSGTIRRPDHARNLDALEFCLVEHMF